MTINYANDEQQEQEQEQEHRHQNYANDEQQEKNIVTKITRTAETYKRGNKCRKTKISNHGPHNMNKKTLSPKQRKDIVTKTMHR